MKTASAATIALLALNQYLMAELYVITLLSGTILRYTDADGDMYSSLAGAINQSGTAQAGAASSLTLAASASTTPDAYANMAVRITGGTGAGQERKCLTSRKNGFAYSADASNAVYAKLQCTVSGDLVTCTNTIDPHVGQTWNTGVSVAGRIFTIAVDLWIDAGQPTAGYYFYVFDAAVVDVHTQAIVLSTTRTRYNFTVVMAAGATNSSMSGRFDQEVGFIVGNTYHAANWQIVEGADVPYISTAATAAVGVAVDNPWLILPDATSIYNLVSYQQYVSTSPKVVRDRTKISVGIEVDDMTVTLYGGITDLIQGIPFPQFVANGGFDGARLSVDRCFMATYGDTSAGVVNIFTGSISDVKPSRTEIALTVSSDLQLLNAPMPRNVYAPACSHNLYDAGCGAVKASFGAVSSCATGSTKLLINCALAQASGYFDVGTVTFTSGANAGATRTVKSYTPGVINLSLPLPSIPAVGDTFTCYAGCDKSQSTCTNKFNRLVSFRGFPFVPVPEASI